MKTFISLLSVFLAVSGSSLAQVANSAWVYPSATGNLLYQLDERGQRINDFSNCGYRSGNEPLPNVTAVIPQARWVYLSPGAGDDTALIQAAIDSVAAFTPDANGWRGVVFLNAGEYQLATTLNITASGVVLKGAGDDPATGTRLRATDARQYTLVSVTGSGSRSTVAGTTRNFTQKLVPAGSRTFVVDSTSGLAVGHTVIVSWPMTANFIAEIDMDLLGAASGDPGAFPWAATSSHLKFDRTITRIDGNWITVDMPLPQTFEQQYGGGQIWRYTWTGRIEQVGIEDIYGFSDYASSTDENHAWVFIGITNTQHGWVKNITGQYFGGSAVLMNNGVKWFTVADSQCLDPISIITGGRRYSFNNDGAEATLIVNCYAREGRHDFAFGSGVAGPNAIVQCSTDTSYSDTGPHHRWSVGGLFDLVTVNGNSINAENRGNLGTGQGWAGAYMAVWNSKANQFNVRNPPTARNWLIGSIGTIGSKSNYPIGADPAGTYESSGPSGTGKNVYPRSLYHGQLQQRMKWKDSEFSEWWLGDVDQHSSIGGTGEAMNCDVTWLSQVEALGAQPAVAKFDELAGSRHVAFTLDVPNTPGDTVVAASLTVSLRAIGNATAGNIWLDSTASPQTFASLGWNPISTTAPTVRTIEVSSALLSDGKLNVALGTNVAVDYAVLLLQMQKTQPSVSMVTLPAEADAYVQGGQSAGANFGTATTLETKDDGNVDFDREAFVRWDLSGITGKIVHAKVRLVPTTTGQVGNENAASFVSNDTWSETAVTFATKPAAQPFFAQWLPVANQAVEFSVTPQVQDAQLGDAILSLRIASTDNHGAAGNVSYASRENATPANRPQLILTIENPPTAAVKASTGNILSTDATWTNGFVPVNPDTATWNSTSLAGTMTFDTNLNWAGLIVTDPAGPLIFNSGQFLLLGSQGIDLSASTVDLTFNHPVHFSADQTWNIATGRSLAVNGPISGSLTLEKSVAGNLVFSANNTYTGTVAIRQGTLQVNAGGTLGANTASLSLGTGSAGVLGTVGNLTLNTSATLGSLAIKSNTATTASCLLSIASGSTLTVSGFQSGVIGTEAARAITNLSTGTAGTGGSLVVNGDFHLSEQHSNSVVNLSGLAAFRVQSPNGSFSLGMNNRSVGTLTLANSTNIINVGTLSVGFTSTGNSGGVSTLNLGAGTNAIHAPVINIGGVKSPGQILFPGSGGSLVITGADGSGSSLITIGHSSAGTYSGNNNLFLAGRNATVNASTVTIGQKSGAGTGTVGATVTFDMGTFTANTIQMGVAGGTSSGAINSGFTVGGATANSAATGVVNISDNLLLAAATAGTATTTTTLVINGGTVNVNTAASGANGIFDTSVGAGNSSTSLTLAGGTLNLNGGSIGGTTGTGKKNIGTLDFRTGTLRNVAQINGGTGLTKNSTGTLTLSGTNTYTGPTTISAGTLALGVGNALPDASPLTLGAATLHASTGISEIVGTLTVSAGATINLAPSAKIEFFASDALAWPGTLNITGSFVSGVSLRFGNSASGLTSTQLAKISAPGYTDLALNSSGYLTATALPDTAPPTISSINYGANATGVPVGVNFVVTFSESITIDTGDITIRNVTDGTETTIDINDTAQVSISGDVLTINPTITLAANKTYAILIAPTAINDTAGNSFAGITNTTTWNFSTAAPDPTAPTISSLSPADNATGVASDLTFVATFSEPIAIGTGNITLKNLTDTTETTIALTDTDQVSISGATLTINPAANLTPNTTYAIQVASTAIKDLSDNLFAGISNDTIWNFVTIDTAPPEVSSFSPANDSTDIAVGSELLVTFSEPIAIGGGNITLKNLTNGAQTTIPITDATQVAITGSNLTISPAADLLPGRNYAVQIAEGAILDLTQNSFGGILDDTTWTFTTAGTIGDGVWTYNGANVTSNTWTTAGSWLNSEIAGGVDATASFNLDITATRTITLGGNRTIGNIAFTDTASSHDLTLTSNSLTLDVTTGAPTINVNQADRTLAITSSVTGSDGLTKNGSGALLLSGANTYTGGTTINAGTVRMGNAVALGAISSAVSVASGARLEMNGVNMGTNPRALTLNGFGIGGTGALLNSSTSADGVYSGVVTLGSNSTIGNTSAGRVMRITDGTNSTINTGGFTVTFKGAGSVNIPRGTGISGNGSVVVDGLLLSLITAGGNSLNNYTGTTTVINGGSILFFNNNIGTGNINLNGGTLLGYANADLITRGFGPGSNQIQITGGESGFGGGSGTTINLNNITEVQWGNASFNPSKFILRDGLTFQDGIDLNGANRTVTGTGGTLSGVIRNTSGTPAGLVKEGTGLLTLSNANTFNGTTTLSGGILSLTHASALQNSALDTANSVAGTATAGLRTNQSTLTLGGLIGNKDFDDTAGSVFTTSTPGYSAVTALTLRVGTGNSFSYSGAIGNGAATTSLTKSGLGTQILSGANTYTGTTTVSAGTLEVIGSLGATAVSVNAGTLAGNGNFGGNVTVAVGAAHALAVAATTAGQDTSTIGGRLEMAQSTLNLTAASTPAAGVYVLATAAVDISGFPSSINYNGIAGTVSVDNASTPKRLLLTVTGSPYETWGGSGVAFDADTNNDGVANGMAWLLGAANPSEEAFTRLPTVSVSGAYLRLTFRCLKSTKRGGALLMVQSSSDLGITDPWINNEAPVPDTDATVNGVVFDIMEDGDYIQVIADIPAGGAKLFGRLRAVSAP